MPRIKFSFRALFAYIDSKERLIATRIILTCSRWPPGRQIWRGSRQWGCSRSSRPPDWPRPARAALGWGTRAARASAQTACLGPGRWQRPHRPWQWSRWTPERKRRHKLHCKKVIHFPVPSRDVTDQSLPGREKCNYSRPGRETSRLGTGNQQTLFYSVMHSWFVLTLLVFDSHWWVRALGSF